MQVLSRRSGFALLSSLSSFAFPFPFARAMSSSSTPPKRGALIFLHGLGDSPAGWSSLQFQLPQLQPSLKNIQYVFPAAPTIPISINGNAVMPGWFDLYDWPIQVGAKDDREGMLRGIQTINSCIEKLQAEGIPRSKIVVGGFSQGGAIALLNAYHSQDQKEPLAGCVSLSGWLTMVSDFQSVVAQTPLFWAHGQFDDKVLFEHQKFGIDKLTEMGLQHIQQHQYPMGHESHPDELKKMAEFLDAVLFGGGGSSEDASKSDL